MYYRKGGDAMSSVLSHAEMHTDHQQWTIEEVLWVDEAHVWLKEMDAALAEMKKLEGVLGDERRALAAHAETVSSLRQKRASHETALADYERGGRGERLIAMASNHEREAGQHLQQRHAHERVKQHHHTLMAQWRLLFRALSKEM
jgi:hypothetical protein